MAQKLIGMMSGKFSPDKYKDTYRDALLDLIEKKAKGVEVKVPTRRKTATTNVVDIMSKLKSQPRKVRRTQYRESESKAFEHFQPIKAFGQKEKPKPPDMALASFPCTLDTKVSSIKPLLYATNSNTDRELSKIKSIRAPARSLH